ncbi:hypothetical protein SNEBB_011201 [Seison nebaliae]|nr:hypothetical protein SNEBB_011201 [Seison nebaliae]
MRNQMLLQSSAIFLLLVETIRPLSISDKTYRNVVIEREGKIVYKQSKVDVNRLKTEIKIASLSSLNKIIVGDTNRVFTSVIIATDDVKSGLYTYHYRTIVPKEYFMGHYKDIFQDNKKLSRQIKQDISTGNDLMEYYSAFNKGQIKDHTILSTKVSTEQSGLLFIHIGLGLLAGILGIIGVLFFANLLFFKKISMKAYAEEREKLIKKKKSEHKTKVKKKRSKMSKYSKGSLYVRSNMSVRTGRSYMSERSVKSNGDILMSDHDLIKPNGNEMPKKNTSRNVSSPFPQDNDDYTSTNYTSGTEQRRQQFSSKSKIYSKTSKSKTSSKKKFHESVEPSSRQRDDTDNSYDDTFARSQTPSSKRIKMSNTSRGNLDDSRGRSSENILKTIEEIQSFVIKNTASQISKASSFIDNYVSPALGLRKSKNAHVNPTNKLSEEKIDFAQSTTDRPESNRNPIIATDRNVFPMETEENDMDIPDIQIERTVSFQSTISQLSRMSKDDENMGLLPSQDNFNKTPFPVIEKFKRRESIEESKFTPIEEQRELPKFTPVEEQKELPKFTPIEEQKELPKFPSTEEGKEIAKFKSIEEQKELQKFPSTEEGKELAKFKSLEKRKKLPKFRPIEDGKNEPEYEDGIIDIFDDPNVEKRMKDLKTAIMEEGIIPLFPSLDNFEKLHDQPNSSPSVTKRKLGTLTSQEKTKLISQLSTDFEKAKTNPTTVSVPKVTFKTNTSTQSESFNSMKNTTQQHITKNSTNSKISSIDIELSERMESSERRVGDILKEKKLEQNFENKKSEKMMGEVTEQTSGKVSDKKVEDIIEKNRFLFSFKEMSEKKIEKISEKTIEEISEKKIEEMLLKKIEEISQKKIDEISRKKIEEMSQKRIEEISRKKTNEKSERNLEELSKKTVEEISEREIFEISEKTVEETPGKLIEKISEKKFEKISKTKIEEVSEEKSGESLEKKIEKILEKESEEIESQIFGEIISSENRNQEKIEESGTRGISDILSRELSRSTVNLSNDINNRKKLLDKADGWTDATETVNEFRDMKGDTPSFQSGMNSVLTELPQQSSVKESSSNISSAPAPFANYHVREEICPTHQSVMDKYNCENFISTQQNTNESQPDNNRGDDETIDSSFCQSTKGGRKHIFKNYCSSFIVEGSPFSICAEKGTDEKRKKFTCETKRHLLHNDPCFEAPFSHSVTEEEFTQILKLDKGTNTTDDKTEKSNLGEIEEQLIKYIQHSSRSHVPNNSSEEESQSFDFQVNEGF